MGEIYTFGELFKQQLTISKDEEQLKRVYLYKVVPYRLGKNIYCVAWTGNQKKEKSLI